MDSKRRTMTNIAYSYARIEKAEKNADGTLTVFGKATDDSIDVDQQICDEAWLKRAMPDWFTSGGNVREQHSNIAAGVATDYEVKEDGHYITALVVDPTSVKKVETGVLKGFSIGIRGPRVIRDEKAAGGRIIDGQIVEVSLVDRPANPNAKLLLAKAIDDGELMAVEQDDVSVETDVIETSNPVEVVETLVEEKTDSTETLVEPEVVPGTEVVEPEVEGTEVVANPNVDEAAELLNSAKSFLATLNKFDQATFDRARTELANLIIVEAKEMADQGHDERDSIDNLLSSIKHLFRWYDGEVEAGEVPNAVAPEAELPGEDIYLSAESEEKCDKCDSLMKDCKCAEKSVKIDFDEDVKNNLIEKAVQSAKAAVAEELDSLRSTLEAERVEKAQLADKLAEANKAVAPGGPKRTATSSAKTDENALVKYAEYLAKASATTDPVLAKGYRKLAEDALKTSRKEVN
jgi:hypothetical protein